MAVEIQAIFDGADADKFIQKIKDRFDDIETGSRQLAGIISATVFQDIINHFDQQEGKSGPWAAWSKSYSAYMDSIDKGGNRILQDSGRLRQSFQPSNYKVQGGGILFFNKAATKSGFPYAAAHDTGGPRLPKRQFMWMSSDAMDSIAQQTMKWLSDVT